MAITSDSNMEQMQQEALRRARELYTRARPVEPSAEQAPPPAQSEKSVPAFSAPFSPQRNGLDVLLQDKDRTVILALLLLLGDSGGQELLFALLFLLL